MTNEATIIDADLANPNLSTSSIKRFRKLAEQHGLDLITHATKVKSEPVLYLTTNNAHQAGEVRVPAKEYECVFLVATNAVDFAAKSVWYDGKFEYAQIGGQRSGYRPEKMLYKVTEMYKEIERCLI